MWTLEQIILVVSIPSFQASVSKQGQCLISGMRRSVTRIIPLGDQWDISACLNKCKLSQYFNRDGNLDLPCVCMNAPNIKTNLGWWAHFTDTVCLCQSGRDPIFSAYFIFKKVSTGLTFSCSTALQFDMQSGLYVLHYHFLIQNLVPKMLLYQTKPVPECALLYSRHILLCSGTWLPPPPPPMGNSIGTIS